MAPIMLRIQSPLPKRKATSKVILSQKISLIQRVETQQTIREDLCVLKIAVSKVSQ